MSLIEYGPGTWEIIKRSCNCGQQAILTDVHSDGCAVFDAMDLIELAYQGLKARALEEFVADTLDTYPHLGVESQAAWVRGVRWVLHRAETVAEEAVWDGKREEAGNGIEDVAKDAAG